MSFRWNGWRLSAAWLTLAGSGVWLTAGETAAPATASTPPAVAPQSTAAPGSDAAPATAPALDSAAGATADAVADPVATASSAQAASDATAAEPRTPVPTQLQYRFAVGDMFHYETSDESVVEIEHDDTLVTVSYSTRSWKHYRVKSVDAAGGAVLEIVIDRVVMKADGQGRTTEFDSREPGAPPAEFAHLLEAIGRPSVAISVAPDGRLQRVDVLIGATAGSMAAQDREAPILSRLPAGPVAVGATWQERFDVPVKVDDRLTRNIRLQRNFSLTRLADGRAEIDLETIVLTPVHDPEIERQLIQRTPSGVIVLDVERGVVLSRHTTVHNQVVGYGGTGSRIKLARVCDDRLTEEGRLAASATTSTAPTAR